MNIIKQALEDKKGLVAIEIDSLLNQKADIMNNRVKEMFAEAFEFLPEATPSCRYGDTISIEVNRKEILSLNMRTFSKKGYLNTYSTFLDDDFEMKRIIFNGLVARKFLNTVDETFESIFAATGLEEQIAAKQNESWVLSREISALDVRERDEQKAAMLRFLNTGETVMLSKLVNFKYARGKWDYVTRVAGLKLENVTKSKADVVLLVKEWNEEEGVREMRCINTKMKYLEDFVASNHTLRVTE